MEKKYLWLLSHREHPETVWMLSHNRMTFREAALRLNERPKQPGLTLEMFAVGEMIHVATRHI